MIEKATTLDNVYRTLSQRPLVSKEEMEAFYVNLDELRPVTVKRLALGLNRAFEDRNYFRALLTSHPGAGKSTELSRLSLEMKDRFEILRFSVLNELDPQNFKAFDVLILMTIKVTEATRKIVGDDLASAALLKMMAWFGKERSQVKTSSDYEFKAEAGVGAKGSDFWAKLLGLFANLKGEIKYATHRDKTIEQDRFSRLSELIELANAVFDSCAQSLKKKNGKQWLLIGEDFEKEGINPQRCREFFVNYNHVLKDLKCHWLFTLPIGLGYSNDQEFLPCKPHHIPDIPVMTQDHKPHQAGRQALKSILEARIDLTLIAPDQIERLFEASGGNLRDLFRMISDAADEALLAGEKQISGKRAEREITRMRMTYERRMGQTGYDDVNITYEKKRQKLVDLYEGLPSADVPDPTLYFLLYARLVQECINGHEWYCVHPLAVEILKDHDAFSKTKPNITKTDA